MPKCRQASRLKECPANATAAVVTPMCHSGINDFFSCCEHGFLPNVATILRTSAIVVWRLRGCWNHELTGNAVGILQFCRFFTSRYVSEPRTSRLSAASGRFHQWANQRSALQLRLSLCPPLTWPLCPISLRRSFPGVTFSAQFGYNKGPGREVCLADRATAKST